MFPRRQSCWFIAIVMASASTCRLAGQPADEPIRILGVHRQNERVSLEWRGGFPPYRVRVNSTLGSDWSELPDFINANTFTAAAAAPTSFFQVRTDFEPLRVVRMYSESEYVRLEWRGGIPPFRVEACEKAEDGWTELPRRVMEDFYVAPLTPGYRLFRVRVEPDTNAPSPPAGLALLTAECDQVVLGWNAGEDGTSGSGLRAYNVYRDGQIVKQVLAPQLFTLESDLVPGRVYQYALSSVDRAGNESAQSPVLRITPPQCPATGTNGTSKSPGVTIAWDPSEDPDVAGYIVHWGREPGAYIWQTDVMQETTTTITELESGVPYFFVITAYNFDGVESEPSAKVACISH